MDHAFINHLALSRSLPHTHTHTHPAVRKRSPHLCLAAATERQPDEPQSEVVWLAFRLRGLRRDPRLPFVAEMNAGAWSEWHPTRRKCVSRHFRSGPAGSLRHADVGRPSLMKNREQCFPDHQLSRSTYSKGHTHTHTRDVRILTKIDYGADLSANDGQLTLGFVFSTRPCESFSSFIQGVARLVWCLDFFRQHHWIHHHWMTSSVVLQNHNNASEMMNLTKRGLVVPNWLFLPFHIFYFVKVQFAVIIKYFQEYSICNRVNLVQI